MIIFSYQFLCDNNNNVDYFDKLAVDSIFDRILFVRLETVLNNIFSISNDGIGFCIVFSCNITSMPLYFHFGIWNQMNH
jgi:hypothetical protein